MGKAYASLYHMRHVKLHRTNWIAVNQGHKKTKTGLTFAKYIYCDLQFVRYSQVQVQLPCNFPKPNPSTSRGSTFLRLRLKFLSSLLVTFSTPSIKANASRSTLGQFCTTPPVGILLGSRSKSLGWIPTVSIPNPDQPPLMIFLTQPYFSTKRKLNKHVIATSSQQNPNNFFCHSVFHFIC